MWWTSHFRSTIACSPDTLSRVKKTGRFLRDAIEMRLRMNADYVRAGRWHEALSLKVLPPNVPLSLQQLTTLMDEMWHQAGDSSVDVRSRFLDFHLFFLLPTCRWVSSSILRPIKYIDIDSFLHVLDDLHSIYPF